MAAPTGPSYRPRRFEVMTANGKTYTDGVLVGGFGVVATSVRFSQSLAGQETKRAANGTYVVVHLIVDNRTSHARSMDPSDIQLKDSQGRTFDQSPHGETALSSSGASVLSLRRLAPNVLVQGDVAYDVPLGDAHDPVLQLLVTAGTHHAEHTVPVPLASLLK